MGKVVGVGLALRAVSSAHFATKDGGCRIRDGLGEMAADAGRSGPGCMRIEVVNLQENFLATTFRNLVGVCEDVVAGDLELFEFEFVVVATLSKLAGVNNGNLPAWTELEFAF